MSPSTEEPRKLEPRKPQLAFLIATSLGLGYLPKAPGTWGSLGGIFIYVVTLWGLHATAGASTPDVAPQAGIVAFEALAIAAAGVWAADRVARFSAVKDPQFVVVDEVSGQHLAYTLALAPLNWKYLVLGFILFRAFDIWKPFPARQAESLPGGLGIMADDWAAGIYAALGLWLARYLGL